MRAYEDVFYYVWRERRLPANVDPLDSRLDDAQERRSPRCACSRHGLDSLLGYVLPIARDATGTHWQSGPWFMRRERCYLIPGDSPLGYAAAARFAALGGSGRLSVCACAGSHADVSSRSRGYARVRQQARTPVHARRRGSIPGATGATRAIESAHWVARTAMCAEPRHGVLYVFMPPTAHLEDYLELVAAVEATAAALKQPVVLEGYEPPRDPRLSIFRVTPDPGVIEVNIHPASCWDELVERTTHLYGAARACRASAPRNSCSMGATGAPAAAIILC